MDIELRLREVMVIEDPGVRVTEAVMSRVGERPIPVHSKAGMAHIADSRARRRSRYILIGVIAAAGAAAAGLWTSWSGMTTRAAPAPVVADVLAPAPVVTAQPVTPEPLLDEPPLPASPAFTGRVPVEQAIPGKAAQWPTDAEDCCVPALPSVEDYKLPKDSPGARFSIALGAEAEDPSWAPDMKRRIKEELQEIEELRGVPTMMECRSTACGLLFIYPPGGDSNALDKRITDFKDLAASKLGFASRGSSGMHYADGTGILQVQLSRARSQEPFHREAVAAMNAALTPPGWIDGHPPAGIPATLFPTFPTPDARAAERLAKEPVDRSTKTVMLENQIQKEALDMFGTELNRLTVECRVSICVIVIGFPPGVSPDLSPLIGRISWLVNPATIANVSKLSDPDGVSAVIDMKR